MEKVAETIVEEPVEKVSNPVVEDIAEAITQEEIPAVVQEAAATELITTGNNVDDEGAVVCDENESTAPTQADLTRDKSNKYEVFEKLLSFLDSEQELNAVLSGYFCKVFQVLVLNKPREVFTYIYSHPEVLGKFAHHIGNKSVSEVLIRILNVSDNVFESSFETSNLESIRESFIYKIVNKLSCQNDSFEDHLNAQSLLSEIVEYK